MMEQYTTVAIPKEIGNRLIMEAARRSIKDGRRVAMVDLAREAIEAYLNTTENSPANEPAAEEPAA